MDDMDSGRLFWVGIGGLAPIFVAGALVGLRDSMLNANVALVLVLVVVAVSAAGGRSAGAVAAVTAALSFDFFHTRPFLNLRIAASDDIETALLLLAVGLVVGQLSARAGKAAKSAEAASGEIQRIRRVAALAAGGEEAADVILSAQSELVALLRLKSCHFEAPPFTGTVPRLERSGVVEERVHHLAREGFALPQDGVELIVLGRGQQLGRFLLVPQPGVGASLEERVVAVAIADQVGAALAASAPKWKGLGHG